MAYPADKTDEADELPDADEVGLWSRAELKLMDRRFSSAMLRSIGLPGLPEVEHELQEARRERKLARQRELRDRRRAEKANHLREPEATHASLLPEQFHHKTGTG
jgi:hypothetical protein